MSLGRFANISGRFATIICCQNFLYSNLTYYLRNLTFWVLLTIKFQGPPKYITAIFFKSQILQGCSTTTIQQNDIPNPQPSNREWIFVVEKGRKNTRTLQRAGKVGGFFSTRGSFHGQGVDGWFSLWWLLMGVGSRSRRVETFGKAKKYD